MPYKKTKDFNSRKEEMEDDWKDDEATNREQMLKEIALSEPKGLTTKDLVKLLTCNRETIRRLGNELMKENKILKTGRFGHYHLTEDFANIDTRLRTNIFSGQAFKQIMENVPYYRNLLYRIKDKEEDQSESHEDINLVVSTIDKTFFKENDLFNIILDYYNDTCTRELTPTEKRLEEKRRELLLNFLLKTGVLCTFIMIESIRPFDRKIEDRKEKIKSSEEWAKNSMGLWEIWRIFHQDIVREMIKTTKDITDEGLVKIYDTKRNENIYREMDENVKHDLINTFQDMYPYTTKILQGVKTNSINQIQKFYDKSPEEFDEYDKKVKNSINQIRRKLDEKKRKDNTKEDKKI